MTTDRALGSRYRLDELIGRGSMGEVWRGTDDEGTVLAFKVLHPHLGADGGMVTRFLGERTVLTNISDPHVVAVKDLVAEGSTLAIVMEHVAGPDLRKSLTLRGTLPPPEVCRLGSAIASGLAAVHDAHIVHRDIKPENVLLDLSSTPASPRITDFGVAKLAGADRAASSTMLVGTPNYLAPELSDGAAPSVQSDLYALGVMLYELTCGVTPFQGPTTMAVLRAHAERAPGRPGGVPNPLWNVISWLLHKAPAERPGSARDVASALDRLAVELAGVEAIAPIATPPEGPLVAGAAAPTFVGNALGMPGALPDQDSLGTMAVPRGQAPWASGPAGSAPGVAYPGVSYPGGSYPGVSYPGGSYAGASYPGAALAAGQSYPGGPGFAPGQPSGATLATPPRRTSKAVPVLAGVLALALAGGAGYAIYRQQSQDEPAVAVVTATSTAPAAPASSTKAQQPAATPPAARTATATAAPTTGTADGPLPNGQAGAAQVAPPRDDPNSRARDQLASTRAASLSGTNLDGRWVLQLDSKYEGVLDPYQTASDGSHIFQAVDIVSRYQQLQGAMAAQGVQTLLLKASDYGHNTMTGHGTIWVTLADPGGIATAEDGKARCAGLFPSLSGKALANACVPRRLTAPH